MSPPLSDAVAGPSVTYTLHVGWSASPSFARAVALARRLPGSEIAGTGRAQTITVPIDLTELAATSELLTLTAGWRRVTLRADGLPLPRGQGYALRDVVACYTEYRVSGLGSDHCWGRTRAWPARVPCRLLDGLADAPACQGGDRARVRRVVEGMAAIRMVAACPAFDAAAVAQALAPTALPLPAAQRRWLRQVLARLE